MLRMMTSFLAKSSVLTAAAAIIAVVWLQYTHPDLHNRSTDDLRSEVMRLNLDHLDLPVFLRVPSMMRQEYVSNELAAREQVLIRAWQLAEEDQSQNLALATGVGTHESR
jgi:hypothetical protein